MNVQPAETPMTKIVLKTAALVLLATSAHAETIAVRSSACQQLVHSHTPGGADYQPGVDVRGNAVAPADVGGGYDMKLPETIELQIGVDLADRLARREGEAQRKVMPFEGKAPLGTLSITGTEAFWNGRPLQQQDQDLLAEACRESLDRGPLPTRKPR